jgi:hypothetical protein
MAQFFPRMAVYNDVEGWQNMQFWGKRRIFFVFDFDVNITVPADHMIWKQQEISKQVVLYCEQVKRWN